MNMTILRTLNLIHFEILKYFFLIICRLILVLYQNKHYVQLISNDVAMSHDNDDDLSDLLSQKYISPFNDFYKFDISTTVIMS